MVDFSFQQVLDETMNQDTDLHIPVMAKEVLEHLNLPAGGCVVDGTLGLGGHAKLLLSKVGPQGRLIGLDRDPTSLALAQENLRDLNAQCTFVNEDFRHIDRVLDQLKITQVDGMLFDLGISSFQLDNPQRGFSIKGEGPLDMRMNQDTYISAYDLVNSLSEREISLILRDYGEERWHSRIARSLVRQRTVKPLESTKELTDAVLRAVPPNYRRQHIHPATRTFQAFRIAVNRELESVEILLEKCPRYLKPGARICVIAFHSLEDRIVKNKFRNFAQAQEFALVTKKPLRPQEDEIRENPRSRSARLRVAEKR